MVRTDRFFTPGTLASILTQASIVGVLAIGQTFVLIGGGFDLSQGAMLALTAAVVAHLAQLDRLGADGLHGGGAGAWAALLGALNGVFVSVVRTNPFVTTLSSLLIYRGAAFIALGGQPVSPTSGSSRRSTPDSAWRHVLALSRADLPGRHGDLLAGSAPPERRRPARLRARGQRRGRPAGGGPDDPAAGRRRSPSAAWPRASRRSSSSRGCASRRPTRDRLRVRLDRGVRRRRRLAPGRPGERRSGRRPAACCSRRFGPRSQ